MNTHSRGLRKPLLWGCVPSLVVTLGTTSLMTGIVQWITNSSTIGGIDNSLVQAVVGFRIFGATSFPRQRARSGTEAGHDAIIPQ